MIAQYKTNPDDTAIIHDITNTIRNSLMEWYGEESSLITETPEIRTYRKSFLLR